jgi:hypothetical protein
MAGVNALFLGYVMYRSGLVPRVIPVVGLIGAPIILASATATRLQPRRRLNATTRPGPQGLDHQSSQTQPHRNKGALNHP